MSGPDPDPRIPSHDDGPSYVDQPATPDPYGVGDDEDPSGGVIVWLLLALVIVVIALILATR